jgi:hypothetical protein
MDNFGVYYNFAFDNVMESAQKWHVSYSGGDFGIDWSFHNSILTRGGTPELQALYRYSVECWKEGLIE